MSRSLAQQATTQLATVSRRKDSTPADIEEARRDLNAALIEDRIREVVDRAPALSPEQRRRLADLLNPGAS